MATATLSPPARPPAASTSTDLLPRTRSGRIKSRLSWTEKLKVLDPAAPAELTERRLLEFQRLFAFRRTNAIITKPGQGHRSWTALHGPLYHDHIVRHLLGARVPTLAPQWVGARSLHTSLFFCLDVDAERQAPPIDTDPSSQWGEAITDETNLGTENATANTRMGKVGPVVTNQVSCAPVLSIPPLTERCQVVEAALRRLGIDPTDNSQVLILPSPSGGRHYYVFLDKPYFLMRPLLEEAGLRFTPGQIEFFPSTTQGLRLPFGHLPNGPNDPKAWIRFIDNYRTKRIKRHSPQEMLDHLERHLFPVQRQPAPTPTAIARSESVSKRCPLGTPRRFLLPSPTSRNTIPSNTTDNAPAGYAQLVERGPANPAEAEELLSSGIQTEGTRTAVLKHLAAHLIFIKGLSAQAATEQLTAWAMNPRHRSKDIQHDLANGTTTVAKDIGRLCRWYARHRDPNQRKANKPHLPAGFTTEETAALRPHLHKLPEHERGPTADFILHFLHFAKQHGKAAQDNSGYEAAPAVNAIIKHWPGCHHKHYKQRIETATALGLLKLTKGKWQNPSGKGRARTFHLAVPIVPQTNAVLDYNTARAQLLDATLGAGGIVSTEPGPNQNQSPQPKDETENDRHRNARNDQPSSGEGHRQQPRVQPAAVREASPGIRLAPSARERTPQPAPTPGLRSEHPAAVAAIPDRRGADEDSVTVPSRPAAAIHDRTPDTAPAPTTPQESTSSGLEREHIDKVDILNHNIPSKRSGHDHQHANPTRSKLLVASDHVERQIPAGTPQHQHPTSPQGRVVPGTTKRVGLGPGLPRLLRHAPGAERANTHSTGIDDRAGQRILTAQQRARRFAILESCALFRTTSPFSCDKDLSRPQRSDLPVVSPPPSVDFVWGIPRRFRSLARGP